jgi:RHS repeat-associated protein
MDRVATRTDPLTRAESYLYTLNGDVREVTDRKSQVTTITYDPLDRLTGLAFAGGATRSFTYDGGSRLTQVVDSQAGTITRTYDARDALTTETTPQGSVSYVHDAIGRRTSMTVTGQPAVTYSYDAADRLTGITQSGTGLAVTASYDDAGRPSIVTLPNGVTARYTFDAASQVEGIHYERGGATLGALTYGYDLAGRRTAVGGSWARTGLPAATTAAATYDAANQLTSWNGVPVTYDANGNLTTDGTRTFTWDSQNRLTSISGPTPASFVYDGVGRRSQKTVGAQTTAFLYDGPNAVQELVGGTPSVNLLTGVGVDEVFARRDGGGNTHTLLADALGSTVRLEDPGGTLPTEYSYAPFGGTTASGASSTNDAQFAGRDNDSTGLYYYRARYYNSTLQRFVSEDPIGFAGGDVNLHAYTFNSPTNFTDPSGNQVLLAVPEWWMPGSCQRALRLEGRGKESWWDRFWCRLELSSSLPTPMAMAAVPKFATAAGQAMATAARNGSARSGLARLTGLIPKGAQAHHNFPVKFADFFASKGVNINDPRFMTWWKSTEHLKNARAFSTDWADWIAQYGQSATYAEVMDAGAKIASKYGIPFWY